MAVGRNVDMFLTPAKPSSFEARNWPQMIVDLVSYSLDMMYKTRR